jgi:hypothetical protein
MSVSHSRFGASAVNACRVRPFSSVTAHRSSWTAGPGLFPFLPRFFPKELNQPFSEAIFHAVRSASLRIPGNYNSIALCVKSLAADDGAAAE